MKSLIIISIISATFCGFASIDYEYLKEHAPFQVYTPEENPFRDYTEEEIRALFGEIIEEFEPVEEEEPNPNLPDSFDFRTNWKDCVGTIRDQASCGSCWSFAGTVCLQQRFCIASGGAINVVLSTQDSVSCNTANYGCNGGYRDKTWDYFVSTGVVLESCFPYASQTGTEPPCITSCQDGSQWKKYKAKSYKLFSGVNAIKNELVTNGPIHTGFTVYSDFMSYKSGIYVYTSGSKVGGHAVIIIGYGVENGINYWICQNSWGASWGENGYFRIKMGECGIDSASYAGPAAI